jgi:hypothetical protein
MADNNCCQGDCKEPFSSSLCECSLCGSMACTFCNKWVPKESYESHLDDCEENQEKARKKAELQIKREIIIQELKKTMPLDDQVQSGACSSDKKFGIGCGFQNTIESSICENEKCRKILFCLNDNREKFRFNQVVYTNCPKRNHLCKCRIVNIMPVKENEEQKLTLRYVDSETDCSGWCHPKYDFTLCLGEVSLTSSHASVTVRKRTTASLFIATCHIRLYGTTLMLNQEPLLCILTTISNSTLLFKEKLTYMYIYTYELTS